MDYLLAVIMGVGLAAACGFRVFVPLLVVAIAVRAGHMTVSPAMAWLGSDLALILLGTATVLEIVAYYVPWLDNLLDSIATPTAVVAGTLAAATFITSTSPMMDWTLAVILGGGAAAAVQVTTVAVRAGSTALTGGLANPVVATVENVAAGATAVLAVVLPILLAGVLLALLIVAVLFLRRVRRARAAVPVPA